MVGHYVSNFFIVVTSVEVWFGIGAVVLFMMFMYSIASRHDAKNGNSNPEAQKGFFILMVFAVIAMIGCTVIFGEAPGRF